MLAVEMPRPTPLLARGAGGFEREGDAEGAADATLDDDDGAWFACRACRTRVAPRSALFAVDGQTDHVRHNPHGLVFHIRCLRRAPGARAVGDAILAHTWFAGHPWRIALCGGCGVHLGWRFERDAVFWGLIADRLVEVRPD